MKYLRACPKKFWSFPLKGMSQKQGSRKKGQCEINTLETQNIQKDWREQALFLTLEKAAKLGYYCRQLYNAACTGHITESWNGLGTVNL